MEKRYHQLRFQMAVFVLCLPLLINAAAEHILLNCGLSGNSPALDRQSWDGDDGTKFSPDINTASISLPAQAERAPQSEDPVPYMTARIILSQFSYTFPVSPGQKILRLYFYPTIYINGSRDTSQSFFDVRANQYILLRNFSAYLSVQGQKPNSSVLVKEFIVNVEQAQVLNVTFLPSANSYAFVNGIEVVSAPDNLYMGSHDSNNNPLRSVNSQNSAYDFDRNETAFERLYRLNVGGQSVSPVQDTAMFRTWLQDEYFISGGIGNPLQNDSISLNYSKTPTYSAPRVVYTTARAIGIDSTNRLDGNLTWIFQVDSGFHYILRLHFCEFMPYVINSTNQRVFSIFINNMMAEVEADVIRWAGGTGIPIFRDYVVLVSTTSGRQSKQNLSVALLANSDTGAEYLDAILNGLEIFKLNDTDGNLAGPNPEPVENPDRLPPDSKPHEKKKKRVGIVPAVVGGVAGGAAIVLILSLWICRRRRGTKDFDRKSASKSSWGPLSTPSRSTKTSASGGSSSLPSDLCRRFLLEEIKSATANFNGSFVIGTGGFGNVYRGYIDNNLTTVAIKRLDPSSRQGAHEFRTEIEMLSNLRHVHLVSLIGYCDDRGEMILVYDYMANGTLRDHLYKTENPPLAWKQRLQISIGAAKGLQYLHSGAKQNIIHRDVKSTNILLDEKWVAKVSDFGLSKLGPEGGIQSHVSTQVKGSIGYLDPEYYKRQQLTEKSDVYSFGVVLFELLCARPAVLPTLPREQVNLAEWARKSYRKGTMEQIVDVNLKGQIAPECLTKFSEIAFSCLKDQGIERPSMSDIVWSLEFALKLQEAAEKEGDLRPINLPLNNIHGEGEGEGATTDETKALLTSSGSGGGVNINVSSLLKSQTGTKSSTTTTSVEGGGMFSSDTSITDKLKSDSVFSEIMNPAGR